MRSGLAEECSNPGIGKTRLFLVSCLPYGSHDEHQSGRLRDYKAVDPPLGLIRADPTSPQDTA